MEPRDLVNVTEAVRLTGLEKATLYRLARQGRVRAFRVLNRRCGLSAVISLRWRARKRHRK
jgi:hypothetical protein